MYFFFAILLLLIAGHALGDYALQTSWMAAAKNPNTEEGQKYCWWIVLSCHSAIHAGLVLLITGSLGLAVIELLSHFVIDFLKCEKVFSFKVDQTLHLSLKLFYAIVTAIALIQ